MRCIKVESDEEALRRWFNQTEFDDDEEAEIPLGKKLIEGAPNTSATKPQGQKRTDFDVET